MTRIFNVFPQFSFFSEHFLSFPSLLGSELLFTIFLCQLDQRHCLRVWVFVILWYSPKEASWQLMNQSCYNSANYKLLACSQSSVHHPISATMKGQARWKEIYRRLRQKRTISLVTKLDMLAHYVKKEQFLCGVAACHINYSLCH